MIAATDLHGDSASCDATSTASVLGHATQAVRRWRLAKRDAHSLRFLLSRRTE